MKIRTFILIMCTSAIVTQLSFVTQTLAESNEDAKARYSEGIELFEAGEYKKAAEAFRAAYSAKASWKMFYNIGQAEAAGHRYGLALEAFETYLVQGGDDVPEDRHGEVLSEIQRLRMLVGVVELSAPAGAELLIDDVTRGTTPFEGPVRTAAGKHKITIRHNGEVILEKQVRVAGGMSTTIDAQPEEEQVGPAEPETNDTTSTETSSSSTSAYGTGPVDRPKKMSGMMIGGIVAAGVGVVGAGLGTAFLIKGYKDSQDAADSNDQDVKDDYHNNKKPLNQAMTITGFAVAGVGIAVGTVLIVLDVKNKKKRESSKVSVTPTLSGVSVSF